jgi:hypothetical protein
MKLVKSFLMLACGATMLAFSAQAMEQGIVRAFMVQGEVSLLNNDTRETMPLQARQDFSDGYTVVTGSDSSALLLFSNGTSINVTENSSFNVRKFLQDEFDQRRGSFLRLREEPSPSHTDVMLSYGEAIGETRKLRNDSEMTVRTPIGSAGIRGTTFIVSFDPNTGTAYFVNMEGAVEVTNDLDGSIVTVADGEYYEIVARQDEDGNWILESASIHPATPQQRQRAQQAINRFREAQREMDQEADPTDLTPPTDSDPDVVSPS